MHFSVSDFLSDVIVNAIESGASAVNVVLMRTATDFGAEVCDNGCGMDESEILDALDPFYTNGHKHPGRRVGLGLPFLKQAADKLGGKFAIESRKGTGTIVRFDLPLDNIDSPPVGDLAGTLTQAFAFDGDYELSLSSCNAASDWTLHRSQLKTALGDLDTAASLTLLRKYLESLEEDNGENDA